jgi:hypothetical protein
MGRIPLVRDDSPALHWSDGDRMTIDLEDVPVRVGRIFTVDGSDGRFHYSVRDVQRI